MKPNVFKHIIQKFLQGKTSAADETLLNRFENELLERNAAETFAHTPAETVHDELSARISQGIGTQRSYGRWVAAAAVILLIAGLFTWQWFSSSPTPTIATTAPATQWQVITTAQGETRTLSLPDGSTVTLNSRTTLRYPENFTGEVREVQLSGEAFFSVTKNPQQPFIVTTDGLTTRVLGTTFNVEAYPTQTDVKVTLATGKVSVAAGAQQCELQPAQQAVFEKTAQQLQVQTVDIANFTDWKDGLLRFSESTLPAVVQKLEKRYGVQIRLEVTNADHCYVSGTFVNEDLKVVLQQLIFVHSGLSYEYIDSDHLVIKGACE